VVPVSPSSDSPRDLSQKQAREGRSIATVRASARCLTREAGTKTSGQASGHGSDEVATDGAQVSPEPSALYLSRDFADIVSPDRFDDFSEVSRLPIGHEDTVRPNANVLFQRNLSALLRRW
jgi:hypothetical protein